MSSRGRCSRTWLLFRADLGFLEAFFHFAVVSVGNDSCDGTNLVAGSHIDELYTLRDAAGCSDLLDLDANALAEGGHDKQSIIVADDFGANNLSRFVGAVH